jgi:hypothetical protein
LRSCVDGADGAWPNPDPQRFFIRQHAEIGRHCLVLLVQYPNCTNFEGSKILVYVGVTYDEIRKADRLDPHFTDRPGSQTPLARFRPTEEGWNLAIRFCRMMEEQE